MMVDPFSADFDRPIGPPDDRRGLLVVTDGPAREDVEAVAEAAGLRLLDLVPLDSAPARLDMQADCNIVLLFCQAPSPSLERLLVQAETIAIQNNMAVILIAGIETLDLAYACMRSPRTQLLCNPDDTDIAAALLAAAREDGRSYQVHDDRQCESNRLDQLSEEVSRLARTIEALTTLRPRAASPSFDQGTRISDRPGDYIGMPAISPMGDEPGAAKPGDVSAMRVRDLLRARRMRADFLPGDLFADPAWDMLLDLLAARLEHDRVSVSSLCIASDVPPTTALRWIRTLTDRGLVERQADPHDGRRVFIALAEVAADALIRWFTGSRRYLCD